MSEHRKSRKILFLSNDVVYLYRFRGPLMRSFVEKGYEVLAVAPPQDGAYEAEIAKLGARYEPWLINKTSRNPIAEWNALAQLFRIFAKFKPSIFFGYTIKPVIYGLIVARILGVPRRVGMITGLGYAFLPGGGATKRLVRAVARLGYSASLRQASMVLFQNGDDLNLFRELSLVSQRTRVALVNGSGVDLAEFSVAPFPSGPPVFLMVARLLRDKGVYEFVEAARLVKAQVPDARFVLVGAADSNPAAVAHEDVDRWVAEGVIEARGHLADPKPEYAAAHVFVLPSYREGTPRTNLEAMATGRAVITSDAPGCRETVVNGVNGLLVPVRDTSKLAEAMLSLARNLDRARVMGAEGRRLCEDRFELGTVTDATVALIESSNELLS